MPLQARVALYLVTMTSQSDVAPGVSTVLPQLNGPASSSSAVKAPKGTTSNRSRDTFKLLTASVDSIAFGNYTVSQEVRAVKFRNSDADRRSWMNFRGTIRRTGVDMLRLSWIQDKAVLQDRLGKMRRESRCVLNPENNKFMMGWDLSSLCLLCCMAVFTPLEAGFQKDAEAWSPRWSFNQFINLFFAFDLVLQFNLPYAIPTKHGQKLVFSRSAIVVHYLRTWFLVDLVSMVPFDLLIPGKSLGALRAVRLLRLLKLLRLLRGIRIVRRIQTEVGLSFRKFQLAQLFFAVIIAAHWIACLLGCVSRWQVSEGEVCWNAFQQDCVLTWMTEGLAVSGVSEMLSDGDVLLRTYLTAMHASMSILVHPHTYMPTNIGEQVAFILLMLIGGFIWTQVISRSTAIFTSLDRHRIFFQQTLDDVNSISYNLGLSPGLRKRLRKFFLTANRTSNQEVWKGLVSRVSPQLRRDISRELNKAWVLRIHVLAKCQSTSFVTSIAEKLISQQFAEGEMFGSPFHLYVLAGGLARIVPRLDILIKDSVWGEDHLLLTNRMIISDNTAQALTFTETRTLSQEDFSDALADFPEFTSIIRWARVRHILVRGLRLLAEADNLFKTHEAQMMSQGLSVEAKRPSLPDLAGQIGQFGLDGIKVFRRQQLANLTGNRFCQSISSSSSCSHADSMRDSFDNIKRHQMHSFRRLTRAPSVASSTRFESGIFHQQTEDSMGSAYGQRQLAQSIETLSEQVRLQGAQLEKLFTQQETILKQQAALTSCLQALVPKAEFSTPVLFSEEAEEARLDFPAQLTPRVGRCSSYSLRNDV